ncbi:SLC13 family permease [Desulfomonile tiedjei]|uniref:Na+/H+ antiporter NhaD-like permease n=1 Tax=Desulfomonile tiedjei (strain ATCC 49306 / DSM 6799 / DCB-1) TaxID=706587 RepID=I4CBP3_DESTA|nr:SLC13 family permease [Desulfomonile tiedjei]AFM26984.1 Na+/H+ antiporter NhaD-like permease [Desulfomonile tiedjei DSM 6799]
MKRNGLIITFVVLAILCSISVSYGDKTPANQSVLVIQGNVLDSTGNPLADATIVPYLNGKPFIPKSDATHAKEIVTGRNGLFMAEISASPDQITNGKWAVKVTRPSFKPSQVLPVTKVFDQGVTETGSQKFVSSITVPMQRFQGAAFWIALVVFLAVYVLIAFEILHRTLAAFLGAAMLLVITHTFGHFNEAYAILTYEQALHAVDWNVVFLLMGMMIIVGVLKVSGVFQWLAYKSFQVARGKIFLLSSALCIVTAVTSAFLDNVTTMLLLTPVTLEIAVVLGVSPFVFLMPLILASNFGGTATLIGDPPNIMIGSYAGLTFNHFVINLTPVVIVVMITQILYNKFLYGKSYEKAKVEDVPKMMLFLKEKYRITDKKVLTLGGIVLLGVILLFVLHGLFHMEVSVAALFGAALIVLLTKTDIVEMLEKEIEWPSLVFFIMLFIVVGGAEQTGILQAIADWIQNVCQGKLWIAVLVVLWVSGIASAIVDNIPYTATMLPIIAFLNKTIPGAETGVLWWALALGACFGGNGTVIGASANVVTTGIAERAGYKITFMGFVKEAAPVTIASLVISSVYLLLFY